MAIKGSVASGEAIANKLDEARKLANELARTLREAQELVEAGENEPKLKNASLLNARGAVNLAAGVISLEASNWDGFVIARKMR